MRPKNTFLFGFHVTGKYIYSSITHRYKIEVFLLEHLLYDNFIV